jgi:hypothetical protein
MPAETISLMGIFSSEHNAATAIDRLRETTWTIERVHSPIPSHAIEHALELPKSRVGWFTLAGGIVGFFTGFLVGGFYRHALVVDRQRQTGGGPGALFYRGIRIYDPVRRLRQRHGPDLPGPAAAVRYLRGLRSQVQRRSVRRAGQLPRW